MEPLLADNLTEESSPSCEAVGRIRMTLSGRLQGVGFRPFIVRLARRGHLSGFVANSSAGVLIEVEGPQEDLVAFTENIPRELPSGAALSGIDTQKLPPLLEGGEFVIAPSRESSNGLRNDISSLLPDTAVCPDCLRELFDPMNRRFRYALISCTACGPRYSISRGVPFDRCRTTLRDYLMCPECQSEYSDPESRRFHSQTIGCPNCGPRTFLLDGHGRERDEESYLDRTRTLLRCGGLVAIKGVGGYHLSCDAGNPEAVARIRALKGRPEKPLAVMGGSPESLALLVRLSRAARRILLSPERPIVVLPARATPAEIRESLAPGLDRIGSFLPATPLQHLLFEAEGKAPDLLVMTSANCEGAPIATRLEDVLEFFKGKIDGILDNDRPISERQDDSLVLVGRRSPILLRRSRGWVPASFSICRGKTLSGPVVLALGAHQKTAPCRIREGKALMLPHMGDLDSPEGRLAYREALLRFIGNDGGPPTHLACDLHPDFPSTRLAREWGETWQIPVVQVGHHHAHVASVMADRRLAEPVLGLALDGFGLGPDGRFWGGELLRVGREGCERLGHFRLLPLPGGERAAREPWRMGVASLHAAGAEEEARKRFHSPLASEILSLLEGGGIGLFPQTSSAGRLFDAAYSLLGGRDRVSYEGQGAMELESWARKGRIDPGERLTEYHRLTKGELDFFPLILRIAKESSRENGARLFHEALASGLADWVRSVRGERKLNTLVLSGGVFQNRLLAGLLRRRLAKAGMRILEPVNVPTNDGGLALGQAFAVWANVQQDNCPSSI